MGEERLHNFINQYESGREISELVHQRLLHLLRSYFYIGGMPGAV